MLTKFSYSTDKPIRLHFHFSVIRNQNVKRVYFKGNFPPWSTGLAEIYKSDVHVEGLSLFRTFAAMAQRINEYHMSPGLSTTFENLFNRA